MRKIVCDPGVLGGKPCIEGTRVSVVQVLGMISKGMTPADIVSSLPHLTEAEVLHAVDYARRSMENDVVIDIEATAG